MLLDARQIEEGAQLEADVCIVGAGAAGITVAKELLGSSLRVLLLESGGFDFHLPTQELYKSSADGCFEDGNEYVLRSRLRFFGGTTNHWTGWTRPLEPGDFEKRSWIPHSGWPLARKDLDPFYERAVRYVEVEPFTEQSDRIEADARALLPDDEDFQHRVFHVSPPTRFGSRYRQELLDAPNVRIVIFANALEFVAGESGKSVERVQFATLEGKKFSARARHFVLAAGGIENARLLLLSDAKHKKGLGNENDLVGRYFQEHPCGNFAVARMSKTSSVGELYTHHIPQGKNQKVLFALTSSPKLQEKHRLAELAVFPIPFPEPRWESGGLDEAIEPTIDALGSWGEPKLLPGSAASGRFLLHIKMSQFPYPESRVTLTDERDALGLRKAHLRWLLQKEDWNSLVRFLELLGASMGRRGLGRLRRGLPLEGPVCPVDINKHHMGTTRMAQNPKDGVADAQGRVHGVENLFIAGSSLFPTVGFANPTLTIVALAIRTADRLKSLAKGE